MAGDSLAANLAPALAGWGSSSGRARVSNMAVAGCGVGRGGEVRLGELLRDSSPVCANWEAAWGEIVASVDPDIVVIHSATWDLLPEIETRIVVVAGCDEMGPAAVAPGVAERLPNSLFVEQPDSNHFGPFIDPAGTADLVADMLS